MMKNVEDVVPVELPTEELEINLILQALWEHYGYDFRGYSRASLKRRLQKRQKLSNVPHLSDLIPLFLYDKSIFLDFLDDMSIKVTEMFRDPNFFLCFRQLIVPILKTYPFFKLWHAGCATGEEVYSMAILLEEEGIYDRARLYATDFNLNTVERARDGIFAEKDMEKYASSYRASGGKGALTDHYFAKYQWATMNQALRKNVVFANHNLVTDNSFGEMNVIICRNVLIYFTLELQRRVLQLFHDSLCFKGILCLGPKESLRAIDDLNLFKPLNSAENIYQRISP